MADRLAAGSVLEEDTTVEGAILGADSPLSGGSGVAGLTRLAIGSGVSSSSGVSGSSLGSGVAVVSWSAIGAGVSSGSLASGVSGTSGVSGDVGGGSSGGTGLSGQTVATSISSGSGGSSATRLSLSSGVSRSSVGSGATRVARRSGRSVLSGGSRGAGSAGRLGDGLADGGRASGESGDAGLSGGTRPSVLSWPSGGSGETGKAASGAGRLPLDESLSGVGGQVGFSGMSSLLESKRVDLGHQIPGGRLAEFGILLSSLLDGGDVVVGEGKGEASRNDGDNGESHEALIKSLFKDEIMENDHVFFFGFLFDLFYIFVIFETHDELILNSLL